MARGLGPDAAVQAPRWHHQLLPDEARYENASDAYGSAVVVAAGEVAALAARNHTVVPTATSAVVQLVAVDPDSGLLTAVSDLRKGGRPAGF